MASGYEKTVRGDGGADRYVGAGRFIESDGGAYRAGVYNGSFGVIRHDPTVNRWVDEMEIWAGNIDKVWMQQDGNLVAYGFDSKPIAESDTSTGHSTLWLQDDGNLVVFAGNGQATWSSREGTMRHGFFVDAAKALSAVYTLAKTVPGVSTYLAPFEAVAKFGGSVASGDNVLQAAAGSYDVLKTGVQDFANSPYAEMAVGLVANVPGFGTVGGAALSGLIAVAKGESLTEIGYATLKGALPGQPLSSKLCDVGLALAKGDNVLKTAISFGISEGGAYASSAVAEYGAKAFAAATGGATSALSNFITLPDGVHIPVGLNDIVNLGADAYNQVRAMIPGPESTKGGFDLAVQLAAKSPDPAIIENTRLALTGDNRQGFEYGLALHAGVTLGRVALASGAPQPALSAAVSSLNKKVAMKKAGPAVAGLGVIAVAAAFFL